MKIPAECFCCSWRKRIEWKVDCTRAMKLFEQSMEGDQESAHIPEMEHLERRSVDDWVSA